jgi:hypothetical protein
MLLWMSHFKGFASFVRENGARGRGRTADTAIFSRMLYQLSYPGHSLAMAAICEARL